MGSVNPDFRAEVQAVEKMSFIAKGGYRVELWVVGPSRATLKGSQDSEPPGVGVGGGGQCSSDICIQVEPSYAE